METGKRQVNSQGRGAIRRFAEGGFISNLKTKMFGPAETVTEKFARQDAELAAKMAKNAPAAAAPAPQSKAISDYAGMSAMQAREKAAGLKTGGAIRGKGTGTSDEIPIMASNGEFMIKAAAVKKIGLETLEALNAIADGPDEKDSKAEAKAEYGKPEEQAEGMKRGGAIRRMATGGLVDEEKRNQQIAQIPTGAGSIPAPAPDGKDNTDLGRNVGNTLMALPGASPAIGAISTMARATPMIGGAIAGMGEGAANIATKISPYAIPAAGLGALSMASQSNSMTDPVVANRVQTTTAPTALAAPSPTTTPTAKPTVGGALPQPTAQTLMGTEGSDMGNGVTRFNIPGRSPLFTNLSGPEGEQSNEALSSRGRITAQNQGALDGIQARQDAGDRSRANTVQYNKEVADAKEANDWQANRTMEGKALAGNRGALQLLTNKSQDATIRRGQDIQATQQGAIAKLAQQKFGLESASAGIDNQLRGAQAGSAAQILAAQKAMLNSANTPAQQAAAEENYARLTGKFEKPAKFSMMNLPDREGTMGVLKGGQAAVDSNGQIVEQQGKASVPDAATAKTQALAALKANPANKAEINKRLAAAGYQPI